jgi:hypothetical protein
MRQFFAKRSSPPRATLARCPGTHSMLFSPRASAARPLGQRRTSGGKQDYDRADSRMMRARAIAVVLRRRKAEFAPVVVA